MLDAIPQEALRVLGVAGLAVSIEERDEDVKVHRRRLPYSQWPVLSCLIMTVK
jgi:hypothetical protein